MILSLQNITVGYRGQAPLGVDLCGDVRSGNAVALVGRNGVGKSTLLRSMAGLVAPIAGDISYDGRSLFSLSYSERALMVSFVSTEIISAAYLSVEQVVALGRAPYSGWAGGLSSKDRAAIDFAMQAVDVARFVGRSIDTLSDGQRQRVMIARALAQDTPCMILDEPTAFLDWENRQSVIEMLGDMALKLDKIIVYSTHEIELARRYACSLWHLSSDDGLTIENI